MLTREHLPTLVDQLNRIFDNRSEWLVPSISHSETAGLSLYEDDDSLYLEAAVPGMKPEQVQVSVEKGVVWIKAENEEQKKDVKVHFHAARRYSYRLPLPTRIDEQATPEARCKDGILKVTFAKSRLAKPMKIAVKEI